MLRYPPLIISPLSAIVLGDSVLYHLAALFGLAITSFICRQVHSLGLLPSSHRRSMYQVGEYTGKDCVNFEHILCGLVPTSIRRLTPKVLNAKASAPRFRITPHRKGCLDDTLISHSELCLESL